MTGITVKAIARAVEGMDTDSYNQGAGFITNQGLRELSGVNGLLVGDWIKSHADEVISHNSKFGRQNSKDPSKAETYYNKHHGAEKITKILALVNDRILDGEAPKS